MPQLASRFLFSRTPPEGTAELIERLVDFDELAAQLRESPDDESPGATDLERLRELHDSLMAGAADTAPPMLEHLDRGAAERAFVAAVRRLAHYESTVLDPELVRDTFGSNTVWAYETDLAPGDQRARLDTALRAAFDLDEEVWAASDAALAEETADVARRQAVCRALSALHPIPADGDPTVRRAAVASLFARMYGAWPGDADTPIDLIQTSTSVFFLVPFEGAEEGSEMAALVEHLSTFQQEQLENFPVFGVFDGRKVEPELLEGIARRADLSVAEAGAILSSMVSVLPHEKTEQYILHDVWGHQWQAQLFRYEHSYRDIANFEFMPALDARPGGAAHSLREVVELALRDGGPVSGRLNAAASQAWNGYLESVLAARLAVSLGALFAEVLADAVEYKFLILEPERLENLMSSSFFKEEPTKLDLTLLDLPWYFKLARRAFGRLAYRESSRAELASSLAGSMPGVDEATLRPVVDALAVDAKRWVDGPMAGEWERPSLEGEGDVPGINPFTRVALNFLAVQAVVNEMYREEMSAPTSLPDPLLRLYDLIVFGAAAFLEEDTHHHFWHVDEFLTGYFRTGVAALAEALQTAAEPAAS